MHPRSIKDTFSYHCRALGMAVPATMTTHGRELL